MSSNLAHEVSNEVSKINGVTAAAAEHLGKELKSSARQVGSAIKDAGVAVSEDVGAVAQETYNSIVTTGREGAKELENRVQRSPLLAIGIACGVGMLASALYFRRS